MTNAATFDTMDLIRLINRIGRTMPAATRRPPAGPGMRYMTAAEIVARDKQRAELAAAAVAAKVADGDAELRAEVVAEITATGIAVHVAMNLTNTTAKMLAAAKQYGIL